MPLLHTDIDERSMVFAKRISAKIDKDRSLLKMATDNITRWQGDSMYEREWMNLINQSWDVIKFEYLQPTERGKELRQNSPFAGILSEKERMGIIRAFNESRGA